MDLSGLKKHSHKRLLSLNTLEWTFNIIFSAKQYTFKICTLQVHSQNNWTLFFSHGSPEKRINSHFALDYFFFLCSLKEVVRERHTILRKGYVRILWKRLLSWGLQLQATSLFLLKHSIYHLFPFTSFSITAVNLVVNSSCHFLQTQPGQMMMAAQC